MHFKYNLAIVIRCPESETIDTLPAIVSCYSKYASDENVKDRFNAAGVLLVRSPMEHWLCTLNFDRRATKITLTKRRLCIRLLVRIA